MGFIEQAKEVQIVSVTNGGAKNIDGANLAEHLSRHSASVRLFEFSQDDAGWTLRDHMAVAKPDLLVMGAFAHSRLLQLVLGGVTSLMLSEADIPVFFAY